jgi:hypothetical protein
MNNFLKWLGNRLFGKRPAAGEPLRQTGSRVSPIPRAARPNPQPLPASASKLEFDAALHGKIEDAGPGKNVLIRNRFVREETGTHDTLKILDDSLLESEDDFGLDPYNTGRFDRSKSWDSRNRK